MITREGRELIPLKAKIKSVFPLTAAVLIVLVAAKVTWKPANQLLFTIGFMYLICLAGFWLANRKPENLSWAKNFYLPLTWILATIFLLGGLYRYDRAGWNWYRLTGYDTTISEMIPQTDIPAAEFAEQYPIFTTDAGEPQTLFLPRGEYNIDKTIVVPRGGELVIEAGAVLKFAAGRSLISYRPVIARGTESEPIRFMAQDSRRKWGVVGIFRTGKSVFEYAEFQDGRWARVNNIDFFATLSVINSDVEISHCKFPNAFGKDAINVQYGNVFVQHNVIENTFKDGIDMDGGSGIITQNRFINCGDEGIDLSDNELIEVYNNEIFSAKNKGIAAEYDQDKIISLNAVKYSATE